MCWIQLQAVPSPVPSSRRGNVSDYFSLEYRFHHRNSLLVGYRRALPGAVTSALFCATIQLIGNEFSVQRVKYVSRRQTPKQTIPIAETPPSESWTQLLFRSIGFQRVAQDEYLSRLKRERDAYLVRIVKLEKQIEEEKRRES